MKLTTPLAGFRGAMHPEYVHAMRYFPPLLHPPSSDFLGCAMSAVSETGAVGPQTLELGPKGKDANRDVWAPGKGWRTT